MIEASTDPRTEGARTNLQRELTTRGVVALEGCYPLSVLASLNDRLDPLDPLFDDTAGESRAYVGADALASSGCGWRVLGRATPVIDPPELLISV